MRRRADVHGGGVLARVPRVAARARVRVPAAAAPAARPAHVRAARHLRRVGRLQPGTARPTLIERRRNACSEELAGVK